MPFYEYRCTACQHQDSFLENFDAPAAKTCPQCSKRRAFKRLISAAGFQLKGKGWYVTDFRDKNKPPEKGEKGDKSDSKSTDKAEKTEKTEKSEKSEKSEKPAEKSTKAEPSADKKDKKTDGGKSKK